MSKLENELHFYIRKYQDHYIETTKTPKCFTAQKSNLTSLQKYCEPDGGIDCGHCPFNKNFVENAELI